MSTKYWVIGGNVVSDYHSLGYTEYSSTPISIYNDVGDPVVSSWQASVSESDIPGYYWVGDDGKGTDVKRWFADEADLESSGFYLTAPAEYFVYGVMDDTHDKDTGSAQIGLMGYPSLIHGSLIDSGSIEYGIM